MHVVTQASWPLIYQLIHSTQAEEKKPQTLPNFTIMCRHLAPIVLIVPQCSSHFLFNPLDPLDPLDPLVTVSTFAPLPDPHCRSLGWVRNAPRPQPNTSWEGKNRSKSAATCWKSLETFETLRLWMFNDIYIQKLLPEWSEIPCEQQTFGWYGFSIDPEPGDGWRHILDCSNAEGIAVELFSLQPSSELPIPDSGRVAMQ